MGGGAVDIEVVADLMVRVAISSILIPSDVLDLDDPDATETMVRGFLLPMLGWASS